MKVAEMGFVIEKADKVWGRSKYSIIYCHLMMTKFFPRIRKKVKIGNCVMP